MAHSNMKTKRICEPVGDKKTLTNKTPCSYYNLYPTFSFRKYNANVSWLISTDNKPTVDCVMSLLSSIEGQKWSDIIQATKGHGKGTKSHFIKISDISKEAQKQAELQHINEDELFSMRLQGAVRLWGTIGANGLFYVIWYDPEHKVCPSNKN